MRTLKYKSIIFDLDGTLLDTLDDIRDSLNCSLRNFGFPELSLGEVRARVGNGSARLVELSLPGGRENPQYEAVLDFYSSWYEEHALIKTRPYPGLLELLSELLSLGAELAIVSNKPDAAVASLNRSFFSQFVDIAVGERAGIRRKPAPDSVLEAMAKMGATAESCVYVGDSEVDIMTARNAGLPCVSVSWGFRTEGQLRESGASVIASSAEKLLSCLTNQAI